jgi:hypothetical protein
MEQMAGQLHKSGFMPDSIKNPYQALAVMQAGKEIGLPPMFSLRNIFVIGGKPSLNAQAQAAVIKQRVHPDAITVEDSTNDKCTVSYWRPGWTKRRQLTFTMADAERAGLTTGTNAHTWKKYPRNMLQARAISGVAIMEFQDVLGGMYTPEELGASVDYDPQGNIQVQVVDVPVPAQKPERSLEDYVDAAYGPKPDLMPQVESRYPPGFKPFEEVRPGRDGNIPTLTQIVAAATREEKACEQATITHVAPPADDAPVLDWINYTMYLVWLQKQSKAAAAQEPML